MSTKKELKNAAAILGAKGGRKGGKARTPAKAAANRQNAITRWKKVRALLDSPTAA
ncbi:MAG TPA: hypothetical protein VNH18_26455 [Bryobacteraceae bacterium]|nr:hypothetical protein [Bryobacteraceae bacterium]